MGSLFGGGPKTPSIPAPIPQAAPPTMANAAVASAGDNTRQRAAAGAAANNLNPTGGQGIKDAPNRAYATLLGQSAGG